MQPIEGLILVTGASGYVGGRLLARLATKGLPLRCMARRAAFLEARVPEGTEVVEADVLREESLGPALQGVHTAYYLIHSMGSTNQQGFEAMDLRAAENFANAAREAGVQRIVYLGGLGDEQADLSPHLRSRHEVGRALRTSGAQVIEFRASVVIGSGSLSFEMLRALVERLPIMITPRWVSVTSQPIAIDDLLAYLEAALQVETKESRVYEIGGADRVSYGDLMREYARIRGLRRAMIPVPVLTPRLSSLWLGFVTPLYARVGKVLIESICHETVVGDSAASRDFAIEPLGVSEALERALSNEDEEFARTRWSDAISSGGTDPDPPGRYGGVRSGRRLIDSRTRAVEVPPAFAFAPIRRIGGETGWYAHDWLWKLRGLADLLVGGVGLRRGRRDPDELCVGDALDWWRVERYEPDRLLRMRAEMKVPGHAWIEFEVSPSPEGSTISQTAVFEPNGLSGLLYWYGIYPLHSIVFRGMLDGLIRAARDEQRRQADSQPSTRALSLPI